MAMIDDRFEIIEEIGRGSQAVTYRARDHETGREVALKELDFRRVEDWKSQELFEREGQTLQSLDHPSIPRYVAAFSVEDEDSIRLFLAQEFVEGPTLAEELAGGKRWTEAQILTDATLLLEALRYLHDRSPAVIHRDVKPSNIIRRADGRLALVDFGAVQNALPRTVGGSTVIGTPGYMPMEQLMGRAAPGSDLYALGATLVHLLTGRPPSELPVERNRLQFREQIRVSPLLRDVLEKLTEPNIEDRYAEAEDVVFDLSNRFEASTLGGDDGSSGEFDRPESHWDSLEETVLDDDSSGEIERVSHGDRTLGFPRWTTVEARGRGEFFLEFETYDIEERQVCFEITDHADMLHIVARYARPRTTSGSTMVSLLLGCFIAGVFSAISPKAVPLVLVGTMAILVLSMLQASDGTVAPLIELRITPDELELMRDGEFRLRSSPRAAKWFRVGDNSLRLETDREVPAIELSASQAYQVAWFEKFIAARTREIAARSRSRSQEPRAVVLDFEQDTLEAELIEQPAEAEAHEPAQ